MIENRGRSGIQQGWVGEETGFGWCYHLGCGTGPFQVAGVNEIELKFLQAFCRCLRLFQPGGIQRDIRLTLPTAFVVPVGDSVAKKKYAGLFQVMTQANTKQ